VIAFSVALKDELARIWPERECCRASELSGIARAAGTVVAGADGLLSLELRTNHATVARKTYLLARAVLGGEVRLLARKRQKLDKATFFHVEAKGSDLPAALARAGVADPTGEPLAPLAASECCRRAFMRGVFLGGGFMADPRRGYHWEVVTADRVTARSVRAMLRREGIHAGLVLRRHEFVTYVKEAEAIAAFLNLTGAHQALLSLENTRIYRDMKNRVNRLVNCDTANLTRTIDAGIRQQEDIRLIDSSSGLGSLPATLRQLARLRLGHPDATLEDLGRMVSPPLSKSGVNHRLRQLGKLAAEIRRAEARRADSEKEKA